MAGNSRRNQPGTCDEVGEFVHSGASESHPTRRFKFKSNHATGADPKTGAREGGDGSPAPAALRCVALHRGVAKGDAPMQLLFAELDAGGKQHAVDDVNDAVRRGHVSGGDGGIGADLHR